MRVVAPVPRCFDAGFIDYPGIPDQTLANGQVMARQQGVHTGTLFPTVTTSTTTIGNDRLAIERVAGGAAGVVDGAINGRTRSTGFLLGADPQSHAVQ